ncbi:hypothetical protein [Nocardia sp. NPDC049526]|uniref:hypothetical protein n=1 Tax=Nocardia sp. NPDC049526 TaxID=3364316 RepID=UPI0037AC16BA
MSKKHYPRHTTGHDDDVLVMMAVHHVSFSVRYWDGKIHVDFGSSCGVHLTPQQAQAFRDLLDAGIADSRDAAEAADVRVDLVKAAA